MNKYPRNQNGEQLNDAYVQQIDDTFHAILQNMYDAKDATIHAPTETRHNPGTSDEIIEFRQTVGTTAIIETQRASSNRLTTVINDLTWGEASLDTENVLDPRSNATYAEKSYDTNMKEQRYLFIDTFKHQLSDGETEI